MQDVEDAGHRLRCRTEAFDRTILCFIIGAGLHRPAILLASQATRGAVESERPGGSTAPARWRKPVFDYSGLTPRSVIIRFAVAYKRGGGLVQAFRAAPWTAGAVSVVRLAAG